uniref:Integrase, catalytic region, zinc finger, CCHC-type, peptidase aspartic, catalytic n=1 Tax=Tanacetum cinerariifolium TaxID=118510 RepID=A0A6L2NEH6_TANCI|nr:integrase, catalytic region, zinc finger, CCHC-type, peptidase aspartic, catalytic [Tanacetum cinerariifolium]
MESVKKSIDERALHKREYDNRVNKRHMQTKEEKVNTSKSLDASLVDTESNRTNQESRIQAAVQGMMHMLMITKKHNEVPVSTRKPNRQANKSVATPPKKTVASESTTQKSKSYYRMLYKNENVKKRVSFAIDNIVQLILFIVDSGCTKQMTSNLSLLCNFVKKYMGTFHFGNDQFALILGYGYLVQGNIIINRVYYIDGTLSVNKYSSPANNSTQQDTLPSTNIHPTSEPSTPTNVHSKENNDNQAEAEFTNPFCTPVREVAESSSHNIGPYTLSTIIVPAVPATKNSLAVPKHTTVETLLNMCPENKAHFESEKEAIHLILTRIRDEIYLIVNACKTAHEIFISQAIDILKQYQKEVNELRAKRIAMNVNPLALVATAQTIQDPYYHTPKSHKSYAPTSNTSLPTKSHATTKNKGKEIAKPITPPSESASEEYSNPEQAQRYKDMQKKLALIVKYFKKIYKPTNNNLGTSSNSKNKNVDATPSYKNDNQTRQFGNQRTMNVDEAKENVGSPIVQQTEIQCFNCKEFGHFTKECRKPKRVKDFTYHKEKMLLCKQAKKADLGIDSKPLEHVQYNVGYNVFANEIQHSEQSESISNTCVVEIDDSNVIPDSPNMCDNDIQNDQNAVECDDERVALANLIANLKLDVDENKKIQKQLKKANTTLAQELKECKSIIAETSRTLRGYNSIRDSCLVALQNKHTEFEKYNACNDHTVDYDKLERKVNDTLRLLAQKDIDIKEGLKLKACYANQKPPYSGVWLIKIHKMDHGLILVRESRESDEHKKKKDYIRRKREK